MKTKMKSMLKRKWIRFSLFFLVAAVVGISAYLYNMYANIASAVDTMNKPIDRKISDKREVEIKFNRKDPISILLVGVDERNGDTGRTDSMIVMTLNPKLKTSKLISIPRDTRADLINSDGKLHSYDKMNHGYAFGGIEMTINSIENFLNIPIDYYVGVNMEGFRDIVDAVGGIDVNNQYEFELDGVSLAKGDQHLNGTEALMYARMRKEDPRGDFGRQERQREVISKVIDKGTSLKALTNYNDILKALENNIKTSLTLDDMLGIQKNYKPAVEFIEKIEIEGTGGLIFNGKQNIWYYIVTDETRQELSDQLREHLGLPKAKIKPSSKQSKVENQKNNQTNAEDDTEGYEETNITPKNNSEKTPQYNTGSKGQNNNGVISNPPSNNATEPPGKNTTTPPSGNTGTPTQPDPGTGNESGGTGNENGGTGNENGGGTGDQNGGGTNNPSDNEPTPPPTNDTEGQTNG